MKSVSEKIKYFLAALHNSNWALTANEKTIDSLFDCAQQLEETLALSEKCDAKEFLFKVFANVTINKPQDVLLENVIKNQNLNQELTLYAITKYTLLYSENDFSSFLEKVLSDVKLRRKLFSLIQEFPDVELDFLVLNSFFSDMFSSSDLKSKVLKAVRTQTLIFLKAVKHGEFLFSQVLMNELIFCLNSQTDLRLWFTIMKDENLNTVLDLCATYTNFFHEVLKFFDRFADEIESNFDEELNIQYSHLNLDFEDIVKIFQLFLLNNSLKKDISKYLDSKTVSDKNFCFWVDLKACL